MEKCIICDLDGTLCLFDGNPYDRDFKNDKCSPQVKFILESYINKYPNRKIIFLSGRNDKFKEETLNWLTNNLNHNNFSLFMRKDKDFRKDTILKEEMYNQYIKYNFFVDFVIDDRLQVCKLWYSLGLFVFNVNQGLIEF